MIAGIQALLDNLLDEVWFELTFLLAISLLSSFLFVRLGQPRVIGYIIVGVIIGPSALGIIQSSDTGTSGLPESITMLAELGAIVLLFMIGLECDLKEIYTRRSIAIALGGVLVPWVAGFLLAHAFGYGEDAIFIGATLVATSVAVTATVIFELGMIGTPVAYAIVGAAVVDDVLGMIVLGISKGLAAETVDFTAIGLQVVGAVLFVALGAWIGTRFLVRAVFNVQVSGYRRKMPMSGFILALSIAFLFAFIAEVIQISAIVGAFVAGAVFSGSALRDGFRKGTQYLEALFVPLFFVSLGTVVDLGEIWNTIGFGIVLTLVAFATKIVGCAIPARMTGMSGWDSTAVGLGMVPRLEIALAIAYYGLSTEIIDSTIYSVVVFMALATAIFSPTLLKMALRRGGHTLVVT
jgi:Kef-type K+ transport system membrane component KefB